MYGHRIRKLGNLAKSAWIGPNWLSCLAGGSYGNIHLGFQMKYMYSNHLHPVKVLLKVFSISILTPYCEILCSCAVKDLTFQCKITDLHQKSQDQITVFHYNHHPSKPAQEWPINACIAYTQSTHSSLTTFFSYKAHSFVWKCLTIGKSQLKRRKIKFFKFTKWQKL